MGNISNKRLIILAALILFIMPSCSFIDSATNYIKDNVEITWKSSEAAKAEPVDSIVIYFEPVYWIEPTEVDETIESEDEFEMNGYSIWRLITPNWRRYEVDKKDTVIYFYRKK